MGTFGKGWAAVGSILLLITVWVLASSIENNPLFPEPSTVYRSFAAEMENGELFYHVGITLLRVAVSFFFAMVIGFTIGMAMGLSRTIDALLDFYIILLLNIPALVIIIFSYLWLGLVEIAAIVAVTLNKIPNLVIIYRESARSLDAGYFELAKNFRLGRSATFRHIILPQLAPYMMVAARTGLSLIWKIVLVVELLGRSDGVGFQIYVFFQLFDVASILTYSFTFIFVIQIIEWGILQPAENYANKWRKKNPGG